MTRFSQEMTNVVLFYISPAIRRNGEVFLGKAVAEFRRDPERMQSTRSLLIKNMVLASP